MREQPASWQSTLARAEEIAAAGFMPALRSDRHWDWVGVRGVLAVVLQALAEQTGRTPEEVPLAELLEHCEQGAGHIRDLAAVLVGEQLAHSLDADTTAQTPAAGAPLTATWLWLTRLWPPAVPDAPGGLPPMGHRQYGGMTRGIGRGHPGAAVDVLPDWVAHAVATAMSERQDGA